MPNSSSIQSKQSFDTSTIQSTQAPYRAEKSIADEPRMGHICPVERTVSTWRVFIHVVTGEDNDGIMQAAPLLIGEYATGKEAMHAALYACKAHPDACTYTIQPLERAHSNEGVSDE